MEGVRILTIGHSTRSVERLIELLQHHSVELVADARSYPFSARHPQFNQMALQRELSACGIGYFHLKELGGMRRGGDKSPNTGLPQGGFRAYADHMRGEEFRQGIRRLLELASQGVTAIMCAEADFSRCHRRMICDYLEAVEEVPTCHILDGSPPRRHQVSEFARREGRGLVYPAAQKELF